uniref:Cytochrome P450 n=1 Tax=Ditylenchus dipsaci TaxID=166011 RepID=A0A915EMV6_9BILA
MQKNNKTETAPLNEEDTYFVEAFLHEMEQNDLDNSKENNQIFKLPALRGMCGDLFFAGQETTSNTLKFIFLYMIVFPEVQTKMQEELDKEIGDNEKGTKRVTLADRAKLPYTNAVINESQRFCNLLPINLAHKATKDVQIGGFKIAKGTVIVPNISNVLYDDKIFPEPHKFMPDRFLEDGQLKKVEEFIPFGIGKRQCMGESLARAELFLFTTNLFYLFKISAVDPEKPPSLNKETGFTVSPMHYSCRVEHRKQF